MNQPKVSICIPAYNQPQSLAKALESVAIQEFRDYEVIITDDSTADEVKKVAEQYMPRLPALAYFRNNPKLGSPENWNAAIKKATGEYIKILHHDDWFPAADALGKFVGLLNANPAADFAFSATFVCDPHGRLKHIHKASANQLSCLKKAATYLFGRNIVGGPSATIYRTRIENKFYDPKLKWVVDIDQYIRVLTANQNFAYSAEPLISTTDGSPLQVTSESLGNKNVELVELPYVYDKILKANPRPKHKLFMLFYLTFVLYRCGVKTPADLGGLPIEPREKQLLEKLLKFRPLFFVFGIRRGIKALLKNNSAAA